MKGATNTWLLVALGLLLAASTVGGLLWALVESLDSGCPGDVECIVGAYPPADTVRLGEAGLVAAALGWAAFARTAVRAALRLPVALVVVPFVLGLVLYGGSELISAIDQPSRADEFKPVNEFYLAPWIEIEITPPTVVVLAVASVSVLGLLGWLAHASVGPSGALNPWPAGVLLLLFASDALRNLGNGAEVAGLLSIGSALWLLAALRAASRRASARSQRQPEPATA